MPPKATVNKCEACGKFIGTLETMGCQTCSRTYHHLCLDMSAEEFKKLPKDGRKVAKCDSCKAEQRSNTPLRAAAATANAAVVAASAKLATSAATANAPPTTTAPTIVTTNDSLAPGGYTFDITSLESRLESLILKGNEALKIEIRSIIKTEIQKQVTALTAQFESRLSEVETKSEKIAELENSLSVAERRVSELEYQFGTHQQWLRMNNLEISGVPEMKNESPRDITIKIAAYAGVELKIDDIEFVHRVQPMKAKPGRPKAIIAKLRNRAHKDSIVAGLIKNNGIKTTDIGIVGNEHKLYVHDHLTPSNKKMFMDLKVICNKFNYTYVWTKHCNVYARKAENCPLVHIRSPEDFQKIV